MKQLKSLDEQKKYSILCKFVNEIKSRELFTKINNTYLADLLRRIMCNKSKWSKEELKVLNKDYKLASTKLETNKRNSYMFLGTLFDNKKYNDVCYFAEEILNLPEEIPEEKINILYVTMQGLLKSYGLWK